MTTLLERVASRFGYYKAEQQQVNADWLRATVDAERYNQHDATTAERQLTLYQKLSYVQSVVSAIARTAAVTSFNVSELDGEKTESIENHPFELKLRRPNPLMSRYELLEATVSYYALTGNAYWWLNRKSDTAEPDEIWIIPPQFISPIPDDKMFISGYSYEMGGGRAIVIPRHEIVHFKLFHPQSQFVGLSPLESLSTIASGDLAMQRWNTNYFDKNNAKVPGALAFSDMIDDSRWAKIRADIQNRHGGTSREMMLLRNVGQGGVSWIQMAMSQKDMEFLAGRIQNKEEIFNTYGPGYASITAVNATEANATAGKATFVEMAVWPRLVAIAEKITNDLLPAYGDNLIGEFDDIRIGDRSMTLAEQAAAERVHTIDEIRQAYYQLGPLPDDRGMRLLSEPLQSGGDNDRLQIHDYHISSGIITKDEARRYYGLPAISDTSPTELEAKFKAVAAGEAIGISPEKVFALVGLDASLLPSVDSYAVSQPRQIPQNEEPQTVDEQPQPDKAQQAEMKALRGWLKKRTNPNPDDFRIEHMTLAQKAAIVADVMGVAAGENAPFLEWQAYP